MVSDLSKSRSDPAGMNPAALLLHRWFFPSLVILFLAGHAVCRCLTYDHLEYDEAEQLTLVQTLSPGYYYQPPLFTWLLWPLVQFFGPTIHPLLILRTVLFLLIFSLAYRVSLRLCADRTLAGLAALSLLFIPEIFHGAIGMWTHTSLLLVLTLASLLLVLRLRERQTLRDYLLLGLCGGLGVLAKYNYAHFAGALVLAMALTPSWRAVVLDRRMILAVAVAGVLVAPHAAWMLHHAEEVRYGVLRYTEVRHNQLEGWQGTLRHLSVNLVQNFGRSFGFVLIPLGVFLLPMWRRAGREDGSETRQLLVRLLLAALVLLVAVMIFGGVRHLRQHWLTPFAVLLAPLVFARFDPARLAWWQGRGYQSALVLVVVGALAWRGQLIVRYEAAGRLGARDDLYAEQAMQLREAGWNGQHAVVEHPYTAGYLRLHFPAARVRCTFFPSHPVLQTEFAELLVTWQGGISEARRFRKFAAFVPGWSGDSEPPQARVLTAREDEQRYEGEKVVVRSLIVRPESATPVSVERATRQ